MIKERNLERPKRALRDRLDFKDADRFLREQPKDLDELGVELPPEHTPE